MIALPDLRLSFWKARAADTAISLKEATSSATIARDISAGLSVTCVALPLNLALALASGVPAGVGIITGVVAGVVTALLGGSRLQISGPEAALVPVAAEIVRIHGLGGLAIAVFACGLIQIALGLLRVGRLASRVPKPVVYGFSAGIGLLILDRQLPRFLGLEDVSSVGQLLTSGEWPSDVGWLGVALGAAMIASMLLLPRVKKSIPAVLVGLAVVTFAAWLMKLDVSLVGALPAGLPAPRLPEIGGVDLWALLPSIATLAALTSLGSLLALASLDALTGAEGDKRGNPDQELVAQGLANITSSLFGGLPVMGAIVRSSVGVQAGARTRATPMAHAGLLLLLLLVAAPLVRVVPIAVLAAILLVVGVRLLNLPMVKLMWKESQVNVCILLLTAIVIATVDFLTGVGVGLLLAAAVKLVGGWPFRVNVETRVVRLGLAGSAAPSEGALLMTSSRAAATPEVKIAHLSGPLTFLSQGHFEGLLAGPPWPRYLLLDLARVTFVDVGGVNELQYMAEFFQIRGTRVALARATSEVADVLQRSGSLAHFVERQVFTSVDDALSAIATLDESAALAPPREARPQFELVPVRAGDAGMGAAQAASP